MWNEERLNQLIHDRAEESLTLEYKAAGALLNAKPDEITKDVSAFANAAGGVVVYGISEFASKDLEHIPEKLDPIERKQFSKEKLEHILGNIAPRIQGLVIHPVPIKSSTSHCCYVVEVPESDTVHQATDKRYYRRYNFERLMMHDHEIRHLMQRSRTPKLEARVRYTVNPPTSTSHFLVELKNTGPVLVKHYEVRMEIAPCVQGTWLRPLLDPMFSEDDSAAWAWVRRMGSGSANKPIFQGGTRLLNVELEWTGPIEFQHGKRPSADSTIAIYADAMNPVHATIPAVLCCNQWASLDLIPVNATA